MHQPLNIAGREFESRLFLGTGKFPSGLQMRAAIEASGSEIVTVALRRVDPTASGEDILDFIDWAALNYPVDRERVYLAGSSWGGRGTYAIGLKNPDRFAAIGPSAPATDTFEVFARRPEPEECKEGIERNCVGVRRHLGSARNQVYGRLHAPFGGDAYPDLVAVVAED